MKSFGNVSTVCKAIPDLLLAVPAELVLFERIANCFRRLVVKGDLQGTTLNIIRNSKSVRVGFSYGLLGLNRLLLCDCLFSCCIFLNNCILSHGLLVVLHSFHSHPVKKLHNAVQILHSIAGLLLQGVGLSGRIGAHGGKCLPDVAGELRQLFQQLVKDGLVLLGQFLNEVGIRQNVRHGLRHHLTAGIVIGHLTGSVLRLFLLDQAVNILATLCESLEHNLSKFIVPHRVPLFNKMGKLVGEGAQHGIFGYLSGILGVGQTGVHIDVDGVVAPSELTLGAFIIPGLPCLTLVQNNVNAGDFCHGTQVLIGPALGVVEGLLQIGDRHALALDSALPTAGLAVGCCLILGLLLTGGGIGCGLACLVGKPTLSIGQITGGFAVLGIGNRHAALAHVVGRLVCLIVLRHILTLLVGVDHRLGLGAVLLGNLFQRDGLRSIRGFLGNYFGLANFLVICCGSLGLGFNRSAFSNSCRFRLCNLRLCCLHRFRSLGSNLLVGNFCALLGHLRGFQHTLVFLSMDGTGFRVIFHGSSFIHLLSLSGVQFFRYLPTEFTLGYTVLFCIGQILAHCLLGQRRCHSLNITRLSQLRQPLLRLSLNVRRNGSIILIDQVEELAAPKILAVVQAFLHLLGIGVLRVDLQCLVHQFSLGVAVGVAHFASGQIGLVSGLGACVDCAGHEAGDHIECQVIGHILPRLLFGITLGKALLHVLLNQDVEVALVLHHKLIREVVQKGGDTFLDAFGRTLLDQVHHQLAHGSGRADLHQIVHADHFGNGLCCTGKRAISNGLFVRCASLLCLIQAGSSCGAEETNECLTATASKGSQRTLCNAGAKAVSIAQALAANDGNILVQRTVLVVQMLRNAAGDRLRIFKRRDSAFLGDRTTGSGFHQGVQIVRNAEGGGKQRTSGITNRIADRILLDLLHLPLLLLVRNGIVELLCIPPGSFPVVLVEVAENVTLSVVPFVGRLPITGILAVCIPRNGSVGHGKCGIRGSPQIPDDSLEPGLFFLRCLGCRPLEFQVSSVGFPAFFTEAAFIAGDRRSHSGRGGLIG